MPNKKWIGLFVGCTVYVLVLCLCVCVCLLMLASGFVANQEIQFQHKISIFRPLIAIVWMLNTMTKCDRNECKHSTKQIYQIKHENHLAVATWYLFFCRRQCYYFIAISRNLIQCLTHIVHRLPSLFTHCIGLRNFTAQIQKYNNKNTEKTTTTTTRPTNKNHSRNFIVNANVDYSGFTLINTRILCNMYINEWMELKTDEWRCCSWAATQF